MCILRGRKEREKILWLKRSFLKENYIMKFFNGKRTAVINTHCLLKGARRTENQRLQEFAKTNQILYFDRFCAYSTKQFWNYLMILIIWIFLPQLQQLTGVRLHEKESVIIFDEVQLLPKARQAIKHLVADGRYNILKRDHFYR